MIPRTVRQAKLSTESVYQTSTMQQEPPRYQVVVGHGSAVTVTSAQGSGATPCRETARQVFVTPLPMTSGSTASGTLPPAPCGTQSRASPNPVKVSKVLLKAFSRGSKKDPKIFTLRDVPTGVISTCKQLKQEIRTQLQRDIAQDHSFDVGYMQGSTPVSIRTPSDIADVWSEVNAGKKVVLWCDGLKLPSATPKPSTSRKRKASVCIESDNDTDSSDDELSLDENKPKKKKKTAQESREENVEKTVSTLKEKHGKSYTQMQYRIWAEMHAGGLHADLENPPNTSMFTRAGGTTPTRRSSKDGVAEALTHVANQISGILTPVPSGSRGTMGTSPAKLIENRSKCYKQLSELNGLRSAGVLTPQEYLAEKASVMETLAAIKKSVS